MKSAIVVSGLSKRYRIKHDGRSYLSLREEMMAFGSRVVRGQWPVLRRTMSDGVDEEFWALKDVDFELRRGQRLGIIGRNGAGKSTLLKILSRITDPTEGRIEISGRISSLLEVGTGFHPELSGRENIYLNGAILGMRTEEVRKRFDQIVEFAEIERFLDTPVKRYSSGMYVRLAFAVAAHLEPDILIVDEVLAVGDAHFQKKCLGKIESFASSGRTVIFVSHNLNAVQRVCDSVLWLDQGRLVMSGAAPTVIREYLIGGHANDSLWKNPGQEYDNPYFAPTSMSVLHGESLACGPVAGSDSLSVIIEGQVNMLDPGLQVGYALYDSEGSLIYWSLFNDTAEEDWPRIRRGNIKLKSFLPKRLLNEGGYRLELLVALYYRQWIIEPGKNAPSVNFEIKGGLSDSPYWVVKRPGVLAPVFNWTILSD